MSRPIVADARPIKVEIKAGATLRLRPFGGGAMTPVRGPRTLYGHERVQQDAGGLTQRIWVVFEELGDLATLKYADPNFPMADYLKQLWDDDVIDVHIKHAENWEEYYE